MHLTTKWLPAQRKSLKNPRSKLTFLINGNPSFSRRQAFVYGSSTGFYSDSSSAAVAAAQTAAAAQHQGNLSRGVDETTYLGELCKHRFDLPGKGSILPLKQTNKTATVT